MDRGGVKSWSLYDGHGSVRMLVNGTGPGILAGFERVEISLEVHINLWKRFVSMN